jgi:hypothetical protein
VCIKKLLTRYSIPTLRRGILFWNEAGTSVSVMYCTRSFLLNLSLRIVWSGCWTDGVRSMGETSNISGVSFLSFFFEKGFGIGVFSVYETMARLVEDSLRWFFSVNGLIESCYGISSISIVSFLGAITGSIFCTTSAGGLFGISWLVFYCLLFFWASCLSLEFCVAIIIRISLFPLIIFLIY